MSATASAPAQRSARMARGIGASTTAALVTLALHLAAGGTPPPLPLVALAVVLIWPVAFLLIGRRQSLLRQALVIGVVQLALHGLFSLGAQPMAAAPSGGVGGMDGMVGMPGMGSSVASLPLDPVAAPSGGAWMWAAHALATVLTVLAWNRGERAVAVVLGLATAIGRTVLPRIPRSPATAAVLPAMLVDPSRPTFHLRAARAVSRRRGPPPAS